MVCVYCGSSTRVLNSRKQSRNNQVWRRRHCSSCGATFTTHEAAFLPDLFSVSKQSKLAPFEPDMLFSDVLKALRGHRNAYATARELTATIVKKVRQAGSGAVIESSQISQTTAAVLKRYDKRVWLRYVAEHPSLEF